MANVQSGGGVVKNAGKLYLGTNQLNLISGSSNFLEVDTVGTGFTNGIEDTVNYKITPGIAGLYLCQAQVRFLSVVANKHFLVSLLLNLGVYIAMVQKHSADAQDLVVCCGVLYYFNSTDYLRAKVAQWTGLDTVDINAEERHTFISVVKL